MLPQISIETCGATLGGISQLYVIPVDQVLSIPEALDYLIGSEIVLAEGAEMTLLDFPEDACEFEEESAENDHGLFYKKKLEVFVPKDTPEISAWTDALGRIKFCVLVYLDNNESWKIVGSPEFPLSVASAFETGKTIGSKLGTTFTFSGESLEKSFSFAGLGTDITNPLPDTTGEPVTILDGKGRILATVQPGGIFQIKSGFSYGFRILK